MIGVIWGTELIAYMKNNLFPANNDLQNNLSDSCGICGNNGCKRHRKSLNSNPVAQVPQSFDAALEEVGTMSLLIVCSKLIS